MAGKQLGQEDPAVYLQHVSKVGRTQTSCKMVKPNNLPESVLAQWTCVFNA